MKNGEERLEEKWCQGRNHRKCQSCYELIGTVLYFKVRAHTRTLDSDLILRQLQLQFSKKKVDRNETR